MIIFSTMLFVIIWVVLFVSPAVISELAQRLLVKDAYSVSETVRQHVFIKDEFHYLNVSRVGTFTVYDIFNCTFECLSNPLCFSMNMAASKGANGVLWCELLSSDKYRNPKDHGGNKSSHHVSIVSPCSSSPCQNGGTCLPSYRHDKFKCHCKNNFAGEYCEKVVADSCDKAYELSNRNASQLVLLRFNSKAVTVLCHMGDFGCGDGAWTPVMKMDGNKNTFHYDSGYWSDKNEYNLPGGETGFDSQETKLPTYWNTSISKICLGMKIGQQINFIVINKQANSLYSLIADGQYRATSLSRNTWKTLIGSEASLQLNCNTEGFNARSTGTSYTKARIGYISNQENDCNTCDSRIGFGTGGAHDDSNTCGNEATHSPDNGDKHIKAMGYILVQ